MGDRDLIISPYTVEIIEDHFVQKENFLKMILGMLFIVITS
jgi:hypothetical protein